MSWYHGKRVLEDADEQLHIPIPTEGQSYELIYRVTGTFTGTIQAQDQDGNALDTVEAGATGTVSAADPTAPGVFWADPADSDTGVILTFSAFTSGAATVEAVLIPSE